MVHFGGGGIYDTVVLSGVLAVILAEWSAVGWIGVLAIRDDGTCKAGGYCTCNDEGIATSAEPSRFNYRVVERISENIIKAVIK